MSHLGGTLWLFGFLLTASCLLKAGTVESSDAGRSWKEREVEAVPEARNPDRLNRFGGDARYRTAATGFFRVTKESGKWWLIDPDGHLFFSVGLNSVRSSRVGRKHDPDWAEETFQLLRDFGFNTLGRWSEPGSFERAGKPVPWCSTLSFMKDYIREHYPERERVGPDDRTIPVFDVAWPEFCERYAMLHVKHHAPDPWLFGHFSDNELPFRPDALKHYLDLPQSSEGHRATVTWMRERGLDESAVGDPEVQAAFLEEVARRYFQTVANALKKADPNHLYLGSRLHGRCISEPVLRASRACDIVSINYYHDWAPDLKKAAHWEAWSDRPFLISEFYAMKVATRDTSAEGAGFRVLSHRDAGLFYHTFTRVALEDITNCVGWHWFKYADDNPIWQKGVVSDQGKPHRELLEAVRVINQQLYSLRSL